MLTTSLLLPTVVVRVLRVVLLIVLLVGRHVHACLAFLRLKQLVCVRSYLSFFFVGLGLLVMGSIAILDRVLGSASCWSLLNIGGSNKDMSHTGKNSLTLQRLQVALWLGQSSTVHYSTEHIRGSGCSID